MTRYKNLPAARKYQKLSFQVKETVLTTQPKCMPVNLAEEKEKFIYLGQTPHFKLQDPSKLNEAAEKAKNRIRFNLQGEAVHILEQVLKEYGDGEIYLEHTFGPRITKEQATPLLLEYISENSLTESLTVHWCDNLACSAKMMWKGPMVNCNRPDLRKYSLWINGSEDNNYMRESGVRCLMDHEIGTHFFRMLNDGLQPWFSDRERFGLRRSGSFESKCTEEGLATIHTVLRGRVQFLWGAAFAYYTACKSAEMTFRQLFDHVGRYTSNTNYRWKQVMRVKRGLKDPNDLGGFGNDQCYFEGAVTILRHLETIDFQLLMSGKVCYDEVDRIKRVVRKDCLRYPSFMRKMAPYKRALRKICLLNGLDHKQWVQKAPAAYLQRLDERKSGQGEDDTNVNKGNENKKQKATRGKQEKLNRRIKKCQNTESGDHHDDKSEIDSFPVSSNVVAVSQYKHEEARRREDSCRVFETFQNVTKELTALDLSMELKIQHLRNIVKEHNWSNSEVGYKESLLNEASCELMSDGSLIMSTTNGVVSKEASVDDLQPDKSLTKYTDNSLTKYTDNSLTKYTDNSLTKYTDNSLTKYTDNSLTKYTDNSLTKYTDNSLTKYTDNSLTKYTDNSLTKYTDNSLTKYTDNSLTKYTDNTPKSANLKSRVLLFRSVDFNSNSCRSRYVKKRQTSLTRTARTDQQHSCPPKHRKKVKPQVLTDSMISEKVEYLRQKFKSDVNPHEIIFLEMSEDEDQNSLAGSFSDVMIDIKEDVTAELPSYSLKNATSENTNENSQPQLDQKSNKPMPSGTKQKPNFILRNKLLAKRPSITLDKITKPCNVANMKTSNESGSDSDDSSRRQKKVKKNNYAHIASQYSQFKPTMVQRPKLDREILTADLCKPFFIQAERLLQAEKVLKKTRHHSHARKCSKPRHKI